MHLGVVPVDLRVEVHLGVVPVDLGVEVHLGVALPVDLGVVPTD